MTLDDFPLLADSEKRNANTGHAIETLYRGVTSSSIRNVDYNDCKRVLDSAIHRAWEKHVTHKYFLSPGFDGMSDELRELYYDFSVYGLRDLGSCSRKLAKLKLDAPVVQAMRDVVAQLLPLTETVQALKPHIVKGRIPRAEPVPVNPDKIVKTCPCCFRQIAVQGTMVHHGYSRPFVGFQSASCPGIQFKPLEQSTEGLEWLIDRVEHQLDGAKENQRKAPYATQLMLTDNVRDGFITKEDPRWPARLRRHIISLDYDVKNVSAQLYYLRQTLGRWSEKPSEEPVSRPRSSPRP